MSITHVGEETCIRSFNEKVLKEGDDLEELGIYEQIPWSFALEKPTVSQPLKKFPYTS
jgi:hypothetical protein